MLSPTLCGPESVAGLPKSYGAGRGGEKRRRGHRRRRCAARDARENRTAGAGQLIAVLTLASTSGRGRAAGSSSSASDRISPEITTFLDQHLAVSHLSADLAGGVDEQLAARRQFTLEMAMDLSDVDADLST